jgi:hypothetical protein
MNPSVSLFPYPNFHYHLFSTWSNMMQAGCSNKLAGSAMMPAAQAAAGRQIRSCQLCSSTAPQRRTFVAMHQQLRSRKASGTVIQAFSGYGSEWNTPKDTYLTIVSLSAPFVRD